MKRVIFRRESRLDVIDAFRWYEEQQPGLGVAFREELEVVIERMRDNPRAYPQIYRETRRARLRRFPFNVFFRDYDEAIVVIAVMHGSRDPNRWKRRSP